MKKEKKEETLLEAVGFFTLLVLGVTALFTGMSFGMTWGATMALKMLGV